MNDFLKRDFDLSVILTVSTNRILSIKAMNSVDDLVGYLTGDPDISTIGRRMMLAKARELILEQHPQLRDVKAPTFDANHSQKEREQIVAAWLVEQKKNFGDELSLSPSLAPLTLSLKEQIDFMKLKSPDMKFASLAKPEIPVNKPKSSGNKNDL